MCERLRRPLIAQSSMIVSIAFLTLSCATCLGDIANIAPTHGIAYADVSWPGFEPGDYDPSYAIDGDPWTAWNAGTYASLDNPHWLVVDLRGSFPIEQVVVSGPIHTEDRPWLGYTNDYNLYVGTGGTDWTQIGSGTLVESTDPSSYSDSYPLDATNAQYIKYEVVGGSHWANLHEMEVYANEPAREPAVFGLFVGVRDINGKDKADGMKDAIELYNVLSANLPDFHGDLLIRDIEDGGIANAEIETAIKDLRMLPGDKFIFYASGHGTGEGYESLGGDETPPNTRDEALSLADDSESYKPPLWDDTLTEYLSEMDDIEKWVMIDACGSGGFWGDYNPNDTGDLEKLSNIGLFASAAEGKDSFSWPFTHEGVFTDALEKAFSKGWDGYLHADYDRDSGVSFDELSVYLQKDWVLEYFTRNSDPVTVWRRGDGDPILFTPDMWAPMSFASSDFEGNLEAEPVPALGALVLGSIGLSLASWLCRNSRIKLPSNAFHKFHD